MQVITLSKDGVKNVNLNRRKAIHERCLNCSGWSPKDVSSCIMEHCSLYPYRLGTGNQDAEKRKQAIRAYCLSCMNSQVGEVAKCQSNKCPLYVFKRGHKECIEKVYFSERQISFHQPIQEQRL